MFVAVVIFGFFFLALGFIFNPKIISVFFSSDGLISPYYQKLICAYDAIFILIGVVILITLFWLIRKNIDRRVAAKQVLGKILLLSVNIVVAVVLFEIVFRLPMVKNITGGNSPEIAKVDHETVKLNSYGYRDREYSKEKSGNVFRIAVLGDSFTYGQGVRLEDIYVRRLENILNSQDSKWRMFDNCRLNIRCISSVPQQFEILNFGMGGYSTADELGVLKNVVLPFHPDMILMGYVLNDPDPGEGEEGSYPVAYGLVLPFSAEHRLEVNSYLYSFVKDRWNRIMENWHFKESYEEWQHFLHNPRWSPWKKERQTLAEMSSILDKDGIKRAVAIFPAMVGFKNYPYQGEHRLVKKTMEEFKYPTIDLLPDFLNLDAGAFRVSVSDGHPNAAANKIFAEKISEFIINNWIKF